MKRKSKNFREILILVTVKIMLLGFLLFCAISVNSCSPQRRLHRLLEKYPELKHSDTIVFKDTIEIEIPGSEIKTFVPYEVLKTDTIRIKDSLQDVTIWMRNDTVFVNAKVDTIYQKIYREKKIPVEKIFYRKPRDGLRWFWVVVLAVLVYLAIRNPKS